MRFFPVFHKPPTHAQVAAPALMHCECGCGMVFPRTLLCAHQTGSAVAPIEYLYMLHAYALYGVPETQAFSLKATAFEDAPAVSSDRPDLLSIAGAQPTF